MGTAWSTPANWDVLPVDDLITDIALFNSGTFTNQPNYGTTQINGIRVGTGTLTGSLTFTGTALGIGAGGISIQPGAGAVTLNGRVNLGVDQTWTNNSSSNWTVGANITNIGNTAPVTLTLSGSRHATINGIISDGGPVGTTALVADVSSGTIVLNGNNSYSGGTFIKQGTLQGSQNTSGFTAFGTGSITLGDTSGNNAATLNFQGTAATFNNAVILATGTTGLLTIASLNNGTQVTFNGGITGNNNVRFSTGALTSGITVANAPINHSGTLTNATATGTGALNITANIGPNVTGLIQDSTSSSTVLSGSNSFNGPLTIKRGTLRGANANAFGSSSNLITLGDAAGGSDAASLIISSSGNTYAHAISLASNTTGLLTIGNTGNNISTTFTGGITGNNSFVISSNAGAGTITFNNGSLNNAGTITHDGTGTGTVTIGAIIGSNVTSVIQDSATSSLNLTNAANAFGNLVIKSGNVQVGENSSGATTFGNGTIYLGHSEGSSDARLTVQGTNVLTANPIVLGATSGTLTIASVNSGTAVTLTGGITGNNNVSFITGGAGTAAMNFTTTAINNSGTLTNSSTLSSGTLTFSGGIGANVTAIIQDSIISATTIGTTALTVNTTLTSLTNQSGTKILTLTSGTTGTGNLAIKNNSDTDAGVTISGSSVNHSGTLANRGTGTGSSSISSVIGANVTGVTQDSATSQLVLTGSNTYTGNTNVTNGILLARNLSGSATGNSNVLVGTNGTLAGDGTVGAVGKTTTINGHLIAGDLTSDTTGTLSILGDLTLGSASLTTLEIQSLTNGDFDRIVNHGITTLDGQILLDFGGFNSTNFASSFSLDLFDWNSLIATNFTVADISFANVDLGGNTGSWDTSSFLVNGTQGGVIRWDATAVPEPGRAVLLVMGLSGLLLRRRRLSRLLQA